MARTWRDRLAFWRQMRDQYHTTGAIAPSSRFLARAQSGPLARLKSSVDRPVRVLEVGPGTGAVTREIVSRLDPSDTFDLVEINEVFADLLTRRFESDPHFSRLGNSASVHAVPLQDFQTDEPYDIIISGLPMNNFSAELVDELFESYFRLLAPEGTLSYFEYMWMRPMAWRTRGYILLVLDILGRVAFVNAFFIGLMLPGLRTHLEA